jgi:uncharacterized protein (TIGR03905 family)
MIFKTKGTCAKEISFEIENNIIRSVQFVGGCAGNSVGVARLIEGMSIEEALPKIEGIQCGLRPTSCPDQLAKALRQYQALNS